MESETIAKINQKQKKDFDLKDVLLVPHKDFYLVVHLSEILYIKADRSYSQIRTKDGKFYLVTMHLKLLINKLPVNFIRTHNSYLVNILYAISIHNGCTIKLRNNFEIPISRRKKKDLFEALFKV